MVRKVISLYGETEELVDESNLDFTTIINAVQLQHECPLPHEKEWEIQVAEVGDIDEEKDENNIIDIFRIRNRECMTEIACRNFAMSFVKSEEGKYCIILENPPEAGEDIKELLRREITFCFKDSRVEISELEHINIDEGGTLNGNY